MNEGQRNGDGTVSLVRPYTLVRGRTHVRQVFDLVTFVMSLAASVQGRSGVEPEHETVLQLCRSPVSVSELTSRTGLPLGVVRVLLGDLLELGAIRVSQPSRGDGRPSTGLIREVLAGLQAL
ncbi:DUF742 domain-containing protein [Streptomyces sp. NPDC013178]|uniref:DUF742 domain-containing protein n=1 Tax=Streptomyces sp. NPDC013178 TaxID=3155118 RepID=UPI0033F5183B